MIDIDVSKIISEIGEPRARLIENEDDKKQRKIALVTSLVFLFLFIFGMIVFWVISSKAKASENILINEVSVLSAGNKDLLAYEKQGLNIENRIKSIKKIINDNANWSYVMEKLEERIPKNITLSSFQVATADSMQIAGKSPDYVELTKFVVSMQESGDFGSVKLNSASMSMDEKGNVGGVEFSISFAFITKINRESLKKGSGANQTQGNIPVVPENPSLPRSTENMPNTPALPTTPPPASEGENQQPPAPPAENTPEGELPVL